MPSFMGGAIAQYNPTAAFGGMGGTGMGFGEAGGSRYGGSSTTYSSSSFGSRPPGMYGGY